MDWPRVKLSEIVGSMEMAGDLHTAYLDRRTGKVVEAREDEDFSDDEDAPEWEREEAALAREIEEDEEGRFVALPGRFDIDEWRMMADFAATLEDAHASASLSNAVHGSGAFRRFKEMVESLGCRDRWFAYQKERLRALAVEWCEREGVEWEDDSDKG